MPDAPTLLNRLVPRDPDDARGWILRAGVALFFVLFGVDHFSNQPNSEWVVIFAKIGVGQWFRVATGVIEVAGAALLVFPWTRFIGAGLLVATMLGAIVA